MRAGQSTMGNGKMIRSMGRAHVRILMVTYTRDNGLMIIAMAMVYIRILMAESTRAIGRITPAPAKAFFITKTEIFTRATGLTKNIAARESIRIKMANGTRGNLRRANFGAMA